jgi:Possible hemagglutinin (DUF637)
LARFGTADPMTESPFSTQGWNRCSYVGNSPLNFTDPSGYCFMGCFWKPIFKAIGNFFRENWASLVQIAAAAACTPLGLGPVCAVAATTIITGITSGDLGLALRAGFIAAITAGAFDFVGTVTAGSFLANVAGHAAVGCLSAVASGANTDQVPGRRLQRCRDTVDRRGVLQSARQPPHQRMKRIMARVTKAAGTRQGSRSPHFRPPLGSGYRR